MDDVEMALALAQPDSRALLICPLLERSARLGDALVERCGLPGDRIDWIDADDLRHVDTALNGTLFVYWSAEQTNANAARLETVVHRSGASAAILVLDGWNDRIPQITGRSSFVMASRHDGGPLLESMTLALETDESDLTARAVVALLDPAADAEVAFTYGGRELLFAFGSTTKAVPKAIINADGPVHSLAAFTSPSGAPLLAAGGSNGQIDLWEARSGQPVQQLRGHSGKVTALFAGPNGTLISGGEDERVLVWSSTTFAPVRELTGYSGAIRDLTMFGKGPTELLASTTINGDLWLSSIDDSRHEVLSTPERVAAAAGTQNELVFTSTKGELMLFDGTSIRRGKALAGLAQLLGVSGRRAASGNRSRNMIALWDLDSGTELRRWSAHTTMMTTIDWIRLPNGTELVVSASEGGTVRLWDPESGDERIKFLPNEPLLATTHFSDADQGLRIVSAGTSGTIRVWDPGFAPSTRTGSVLTRGFGDRTSTIDLLNRGAFISTMAELLRPQSTAELDVGPNVLTIEGPWGSGKSTMLELVKTTLMTATDTDTDTTPNSRLRVWQADRMLRKPTEVLTSTPPPQTGSVVATFNPWRHQSSEQVWAGLAKTVTKAVEDAVLPDRDSRERYWFTRNAARVDQRHLQRELWKRIRSPSLTLGVASLGLAVAAQLAKMPVPLPLLVTVTSVPLVIGLLHTAKRYLYDRASAFLPRELFAGPVRSNVFANGGNDAVRDPYYNARSGYLYLVQHDVTELLHDLENKGLQLVVFIDDLDRCTPKTTAEVFEAINVFLSDSLPRTRFVLGLDPAVVASHVDHAYRELADAKVVAHPDDPSPGWTFLRKLVQLPIRLPRTTAENVHRVLDSHLGPIHHPEISVITPTTARTPVVTPQTVEAVMTATAPAAIATTQATVEAEVIAVEHHPDVRAYLHRRLTAQPDQSIREEKRLINVWQFYLRVLASPDISRACHLVTIAELVTRWPAYQHALRKGLKQLADAHDDDLAWGMAIAKLGFKHADATAATNLRALLQDCDAQAVAALAERLL